jgi:hypothetical protein
MKPRERRAKQLMKREWVHNKLWKRFFAFQKFKSNNYVNNEEGD